MFLFSNVLRRLDTRTLQTRIGRRALSVIRNYRLSHFEIKHIVRQYAFDETSVYAKLE